MKALGFVSLLITLAIIGYMMSEQQKNGSGDINAATAKKAEQVAERMALKGKMTMVKSAIEAYRAEKEKYPPDLQTLVETDFLNQVPAGLLYDPATGEISMPPEP